MSTSDRSAAGSSIPRRSLQQHSSARNLASLLSSDGDASSGKVETNATAPEQPEEKAEEEPDFMSDALLPPDEPSRSAGRKQQPRQLPPAPSKAERLRLQLIDEDTARRRGLKRKVWESDVDATGGSDAADADGNGNGVEESKALRMMRLMGYKPGEALGAQCEEDRAPASETTDRAEEEQECRPPGLRPSRLLEPLPLDLSRLSASYQTKRAGLGSSYVREGHGWRGLSPDSCTALQEAVSLQAAGSSGGGDAALNDYRSRASSKAQAVHIDKALFEAKATCRDLDSRGADTEKEEVDGVAGPAQYSPLWLQKHWFETNESELDAEERRLVELALSDEVGAAAEGEDRDPEATTSRRTEARTFLSLPAGTQLVLVAAHLRRRHHHCIWCGVSYAGKAELELDCPGPDEEDH
ncbi:unnamed protein product [Parajaminaea phylloscopi]